MSLLCRISLKLQLGCNKLEFYKIVKNCSALRCFSSQIISSVKENSHQEQEKTYQEIYRFSYIPIGHAINKFKWPQTLFMALVFPTSAALWLTGVVDPDIALGIVASGTLITGNVYAYGSIFHQAVGFMYISEDGATLKISYLDFWGARVNKEVPVDDVMPFTDCPNSPLDYIYRTIHLYSTQELKPKLFLKSGGKITDVDKFVRVFGEYT